MAPVVYLTAVFSWILHGETEEDIKSLGLEILRRSEPHTAVPTCSVKLFLSELE